MPSVKKRKPGLRKGQTVWVRCVFTGKYHKGKIKQVEGFSVYLKDCEKPWCELPDIRTHEPNPDPWYRFVNETDIGVKTQCRLLTELLQEHGVSLPMTCRQWDKKADRLLYAATDELDANTIEGFAQACYQDFLEDRL